MAVAHADGLACDGDFNGAAKTFSDMCGGHYSSFGPHGPPIAATTKPNVPPPIGDRNVSHAFRECVKQVSRQERTFAFSLSR
jgi:hypothetical protein